MIDTGICMYRLFSMPIALAFTAGFIQSAISPTVLVTGMLELQRRGYGEAKSKHLLLTPLSACVLLASWTALLLVTQPSKAQHNMAQACFLQSSTQ